MCKMRSRQDSNLRGQSPVDFWSTPLTAWVRLLVVLMRDHKRSYPSGYGAGPEIQWALPSQVRTLPIATLRRHVRPPSSVVER